MPAEIRIDSRAQLCDGVGFPGSDPQLVVKVQRARVSEVYDAGFVAGKGVVTDRARSFRGTVAGQQGSLGGTLRVVSA